MDREIFDKWAEGYDESIEREDSFPFAGYKKAQELIKNIVNMKEGLKILDIGIGTGEGVLSFYEEGALITGIDFSEKMLEKARGKMPQARLIKNDFSRKFPPEEIIGEKFDYILLSYALHHLPDWEKVEFLVKLKNFLNPGGRIIIADIAFSDRKAMQSARKKAGDDWDENEYYPIIEDIAFSLEKEGFSLTFIQVSFCAGVLQLRQ